MTQTHHDEPKTIRRQIVEALSADPVTALELSQLVRVSEKEIVDHLPHIAKSMARGKKLAIHAPRCLECGFQFKNRTKFSIPSRCPRCKNERISPPSFFLR